MGNLMKRLLHAQMWWASHAAAAGCLEAASLNCYWIFHSHREVFMKIKITIILISFTCMLTVLIACSRNSDNTVTHFADERYELISLILRLTREPFFNPSFSDFHHRLDYTFGRGAHLRHPVISLTRQHISTMNCALLLSIHLQKMVTTLYS